MLNPFLKRIAKASWKNFYRDGELLIANIFIMIMAISVISSIFFLKDISNFVISGLQEKVDISIYLRSDATQEEISKVKEEIEAVPEVKEVAYVSQEEALNIFTDKNKDSNVLMESLEQLGINPFLASLNVKSYQPEQFPKIAGFLENPDFGNVIEKVDYYQRKPVIEKIASLTSNFNRIGIAISIILAVISISIAFSTVRLAIYNSREEIKIQKLVGASNSFICGPFVFQGVIVGLFAAFASLLFFGLFCLIFSSTASKLFSDLNLFSFFLQRIWMLLLVDIVAGIILGAVSSFVAAKKHLKI